MFDFNKEQPKAALLDNKSDKRLALQMQISSMSVMNLDF